jgi:excisionase family DNA binding protein
MPSKSNSGESPWLYKIGEAAVLLRMSRAQLYKLIQLGRIKPVKEGRSTFITPDAMDAYVKLLKAEAGIPDESHAALSSGAGLMSRSSSRNISLTVKDDGELRRERLGAWAKAQAKWTVIDLPGQ